MNRLSPRTPTYPPVSRRRSGRQLVASSMLVLGVTALTSCDPPPTTQNPANDQWDAGTVGRTTCGSGQAWTKDGCVPPSVVKFNTVGYLIGRKKIASVPADTTDLTFTVNDATTQQPVYSGSLSADPIDVSDTGDSVRFADFSDLDAPGTYVIEAGGLPASPTFEIRDVQNNIPNTVYNDILEANLLGLYGQRCGTSVTFSYGGDTFSHGSCHKDDAQFDPSIDPGMSGTQDATGGWHDAGDYGKYTVNAAFSVAFLLKAWEDFDTEPVQPLAGIKFIPGYAGAFPQILAEAKYELDWLLKMQSTDGTVLDLVCPKTYTNITVMPEADNAPRYFLPSATADTSYFAAVLALAYRVFQPFDNTYAGTLLTAAQNAMTWLDSNPADVPVADGTPQASLLAGGPYPVNAAANTAPRIWASVELWRADGEGDLSAIESALSAMTVAPNWDWASPGNLALFDYAASNSSSRDAATVTKIQAAIIAGADALVATAQSHGYGRALGATDYYWGSNGLVARTVMNLQAAYAISADPKYLDAATQQVDYLLGRNPFGRSLVTGLGYAPPASPHHGPSAGDNVDDPWPGLLVGGPNKDASDPLVAANPDVPAGKAWWDDVSDYYVNEVAINWNGAMVYAVAGFVK